MAENLAKLQASRSGYRAHLTQTITKAANITTKEDSLTDSDITSLKGIIVQLTRKRSILEELDGKIVAMIEDPKELEKEIFQSEDIKEGIDETSAQISNTIEHFLLTKSSPSNSPSEVPPQESTSSQAPINNREHKWENNLGPPPNDIIQQGNPPPKNTQSQQDSQPSTNIEPQQNGPSTTSAQFQQETPVVIPVPVFPPPLPTNTPHYPSPPPTFSIKIVGYRN